MEIRKETEKVSHSMVMVLCLACGYFLAYVKYLEKYCWEYQA